MDRAASSDEKVIVRLPDGQEKEFAVGTTCGEVAASIGPGLAKVAQHLNAEIPVVEQSHWAPRAATIGQLGFDRFRSGQRDNPWELAPDYYRKSAAEEKLNQRAP